MEIVIKDIREEIKKATSIALFTHTNCDCDGIGCMCGLYEVLIKNGKNVEMFCDSDIPEKYAFLNYFNLINHLEKETNDNRMNREELKIEREVDFSNFDLLIALDTSVKSRLGKYEQNFTNFTNTINIDHHKSNSDYGKINYVRSNYASCGEVLFEIMEEIGVEIGEGVATSLYAAISSDTNQFSNSNVSATTLSYAGKLIGLGADNDKVNLNLHKNKSKKQLALAGFMASNLKYYKDVAYLVMRLKDLQKLGVESSDVSSFLTLICNVGSTKMTIVAKERSANEYRLNLRSIKNYDVNKVAGLFNGGGHKNAAGCNVYGRFKHEFNKVLKECQKEIDTHKGIDE